MFLELHVIDKGALCILKFELCEIALMVWDSDSGAFLKKFFGFEQDNTTRSTYQCSAEVRNGGKSSYHQKSSLGHLSTKKNQKK